MIGYILTFAVGVLVGVLTLSLIAVLLAASDGQPRERRDPSYECASCGEAFQTVGGARQHVMADHRAPDATTANQLVDEVDA